MAPRERPLGGDPPIPHVIMRELVRPNCSGSACTARPARHYRNMAGSPTRAAFI